MSLSPSGVVPVCLGDLLTVTCRAEGLSNADFMRWNITLSTNVSESEQRFLSAAGQSIIAPITLNRITFNLTLKAIPLPDVTSITVTSNLSVYVTPQLNETMIECSEVSHMQSNSVVGQDTTNVHVITSESFDTGKCRLF